MRVLFGFNKRKLRAWTHAIHQWLGLTLGLLFVLLGLTGSLLVFYPELDRLFYPQRAVSAPAVIASLNEIVEVLHQAEPSRLGTWRIELPRSPEAPITSRYYKPVETQMRSFAPLIVTIDPSTLIVTSRRFWGDDVFTWLYDLHYSLLLDSTGKTVLGIASLFILVLLLSGLYLWWPSMGNWKGALSFKAKAVWKRRVYDLHAKPGAYGLLLVSTLTVTGLLLAVPDWFSPTIERLSPLTPWYQTQHRPLQRGAYIDADEAVRIALSRFPDADVRWIHTPSPEHGIWRIQMRQADEINPRFPRTNVWVDGASGDIVAIRDPKQNSVGDSLLDWLHPLHNGEAFGLVGRMVVLICGFLPLLAFVTGFIRWRQKQYSRRSQPKSPPN